MKCCISNTSNLWARLLKVHVLPVPWGGDIRITASATKGLTVTLPHFA